MSVKAHAYNCPKDGSVVTCVGNDETPDWDGTLGGVCQHCGTYYTVTVKLPHDGNESGNTYAAPVGHAFHAPGGTHDPTEQVGRGNLGDGETDPELLAQLDAIVNACSKLDDDDRADLLEMIQRRVDQKAATDVEEPVDEPLDNAGAYAAWRERKLADASEPV